MEPLVSFTATKACGSYSNHWSLRAKISNTFLRSQKFNKRHCTLGVSNHSREWRNFVPWMLPDVSKHRLALCKVTPVHYTPMTRANEDSTLWRNVGKHANTQRHTQEDHHHLPPWIRSFDLFRHRRIAIVSWGVHGLFFLEVCSWGRVSWVWCCPFFQGGWPSFICIWVSSPVFQRSLVLSLWLRIAC